MRIFCDTAVTATIGGRLVFSEDKTHGALARQINRSHASDRLPALSGSPHTSTIFSALNVPCASRISCFWPKRESSLCSAEKGQFGKNLTKARVAHAKIMFEESQFAFVAMLLLNEAVLRKDVETVCAFLSHPIEELRSAKKKFKIIRRAFRENMPFLDAFDELLSLEDYYSKIQIGCFAVCIAAANGWVKTLRGLADDYGYISGPAVGSYFCTPFILAVYGGHIDILRELRDRFDLDYYSVKGSACDAITLAAASGNTTMLRALREIFEFTLGDVRANCFRSVMRALKNSHANVLQEFREGYGITLDDIFSVARINGDFDPFVSALNDAVEAANLEMIAELAVGWIKKEDLVNFISKIGYDALSSPVKEIFSQIVDQFETSPKPDTASSRPIGSLKKLRSGSPLLLYKLF